MSKDFLKIVFLGTPGFAVPSLQALHESGHKVMAVVTAPDKPAGRGRAVRSSEVKQFAVQSGIPVLQPVKLKDQEFLDRVKALGADLFVVVAFRMMPEVLWRMPPMGSINLHASFLPQYRGAAPIQRAIMNGESQTGITTFQLAHEVDTGNLLFREKADIGPGENAGSLHDRLMVAGARLLLKTVDALARGHVKPRPQEQSESEGQLMEAPRIYRDDCRINWQRPVAEVYNQVRGLSPYPGAFAELRDATGTVHQVKILAANPGGKTDENPGTLQVRDGNLMVACRDNWLHMRELQLPGRKRLSAGEVLRGSDLTGWSCA